MNKTTTHFYDILIYSCVYLSVKCFKELGRIQRVDLSKESILQIHHYNALTYAARILFLLFKL